ncbi:ABC transporter ATP-binding protein [Rufibacter sp. XAAS-G3-1]|uniref:ABC transporter ATP-binding protein n=1 Tax=Rufibacter sp. XAAS-G3-1 TaxID=2729134 RepID=UPI0015E64682|nr:ABC transporter ATP-binding protein [Rufibacter sp. XAAS-G3-1]
MNKGIVVQALDSIAYYLNSKERWKAIYIFILLLFSSVLDVFGLAALIPIIMAASTPGGGRDDKYLGIIYEAFNFQSEKAFLIFLILGIFFFFLFKNVFTTWINYKQVRFTADIALKVIERQFSKYTNLPFWHFNNEGSAKLINNVLNVPQYFVSGIIRPIFILFSEITIISVILLGIIVYQPVLFAVLILVLAPTAYLTYQFLKNRSGKVGEKLNELRPPSYSIINNIFNGFVELKLGDKIEEFRGRFMQNQTKVQALEAKSYLFSLIPLKIIEMVAILGVVAIFLHSILFLENQNSLITIVGLFAAAAYRLMPSINRLLTSLVMLKQNAVAIQELKSYQEYEKNLDNSTDRETMCFTKSIKFDNVSFSFPGEEKLTLNKIQFTINKGDKIGFIGASGSGKTTLMNILLRFYLEQQGQVLVDGQPLTEKNKKDWYSIVGYVKQNTFLMESTIKDNITLSDEKVDQIRLEEAIEKASLREFVNSLPEGVNTFIGEGGSRLSGGQKQRIGIARALYKNTQVLILDEATSALDTVTEREVSEAISKLSQTDITIFIIAHRITTLRDCDRIFEMKDGEIIAERAYKDVVKEII